MLSDTQREQLISGAASWGITLDVATTVRFAQFAALLEEGNRRLNLTRVPPEDIVPLHYLDSLSLAAAVTPKPGMFLLDVGTGAGFPGLPLALVYPEVHVTLLDATRKRLDFLDDAIQQLGLKNVQTLHGRAEEIARLPAHRKGYDIVTARAVARMDRLGPWLLPLVRTRGLIAAYKSREIDAELAEAEPALRQLGGVCENVVKIVIPGTEIERSLVLIRSTERGR